jgi:hypothetical protein
MHAATSFVNNIMDLAPLKVCCWNNERAASSIIYLLLGTSTSTSKIKMEERKERRRVCFEPERVRLLSAVVGGAWTKHACDNILILTVTPAARE